MFDKLNGLLTGLFNDISSTFVTTFIIGLVITGILTAFGGEEHKGKFKQGFILCLVGLVVFTIAEPIVTYFQSKLK